MNKRGIFFSAVLDAYGWIILVLGIVAFILVSMMVQKGTIFQIQQASFGLNHNSVFLDILRTDTGDNQNIADLIVAAYLNGDKTKLDNELNTILNGIYGQATEVCWKLWYFEGDNQRLISEVDCNKKTDSIFNAETTIPIPKKPGGNTELKIKLNIPGYK